MAELTAGFTAAEAGRVLGGNFAPWVLDLDLRIEAVDAAGTARLRMPYSERLVRVGGTVCGQALMALADTAMVFAVSAAAGGFRPMTTVGQNTSFLRPIANADTLAEARVLKFGKTLAFGEVMLRAEGGDVAVHVMTTYAILAPAQQGR